MNTLSNPNDVLDYVGIGIGPSNLSLAALSAPLPELRFQFYERAPDLVWHRGFLFPESVIQTSYLKDLVTPVDPTSKYSFLSFLVAQKRFYSFLNAAFPRVTRAEFSQYLSWVSRSLPGLEFDAPVREVDYHGGFWRVHTNKGTVLARDLVLGTGQRQVVPDCARPHLGKTVLHSNQFCIEKPETAGRRIAVIGGGQAGAELVNHLLIDGGALPSSLLWATRRESFLPLDESPFTNELFTPEYSDHFYGLDRAEKLRLVEAQTLASDGISASLLEEIYRRLYALNVVERRRPRLGRLLPDHTFTALQPSAGGWTIRLRSSRGQDIEEEVDLVLLATGHGYRIPEFMDPVRHRIHHAGDRLSVREDFSVVWDGPSDRRLFVQNAARHARGVAEPNLSLLAWRSAVILNSLADREVYDCHQDESMIEWPAIATSRRNPRDQMLSQIAV